MHIVVIGQSHVDALRRSLPQDDTCYKIINTLRVKNWCPPGGKVSEDFIGSLPREAHFVSMMGGSFHNVLGMVEHDIPFDFVGTPQEIGTIDPSRHIIPFQMMTRLFLDRYDHFLFGPINQLSPHFEGRCIHVAAPPPIPSNEHIREHGRLRSEGEIVPPAIRKKLYDLQAGVMRSLCQLHDVMYVPPPAEACDALGFLMEDYYRGSDAVHANAAYGALIQKQIKEAVAA